MDVRKAYGVVSALGTKLGERAKTDDALLTRLREAPDIGAFRDRLRAEVRGLVPDALVETFLAEVLTDADWVQWRARVLIQAKLVKEGGKPAPGHEKGRGVGRP